MARTESTVGVVIPCRDEAAWIGDVLDALFAQDRRPDEVVVVDDGSTDGTASVVDEWRRRHQTLPIRAIAGPARGVAAAVNAGIAALGTDVVVRLDGHCRPAPDYVRRAAALALRPGVGVAGGAWDIRPGAPTSRAAAIALAVGHRLGSGGATYRALSASTIPTGTAAEIDVDTVPFGAYRRALWQALGGLDERLGSNEDYDFNFRVRRRGLRVVLAPGIRCTYYARSTFGALARQYWRYGWWKARMLARHPEAIRWRQLPPAMLVPALLVLAGGASLSSSRASLWLAALLLYPLALVAGGVQASAGRRSLAGATAAAFGLVQLTWSLGFWASILLAPFGRTRAAGTTAAAVADAVADDQALAASTSSDGPRR